MKNKIALLLFLIILLLCSSGIASAASKKGFVIDEGMLYEYKGSAKEVKIPSGVKFIGEKAFTQNFKIEKVKIPDSVKRIENEAFRDCTVEKVYIGSGVSIIEDDAFLQCDSLKEFIVDSDNRFFYSKDGALFSKCTKTLIWFPRKTKAFSYKVPDGTRSIISQAFYQCKGLTEIQLPDSLISIGDSAFDGCINLESIEIPKNVTTIGDWAFKSCKKIKNINISQNVESLGRQCFDDITSLENIDVDTDNKYYKTVDGVLYNKKATQLMKYPEACGRMSFKVPDSVKIIDDSAFAGAEITDITLSKGLIYIGNAAFGGVPLEKITFPKTLRYIGDAAFISSIKAEELVLPAKLEYVGYDAFNYTNVKKITVLSPYVDFGQKENWYIFGENDGSLEIHGYSNSTAKDYAKSEDIKFVSLGKSKIKTPKNLNQVDYYSLVEGKPKAVKKVIIDKKKNKAIIPKGTVYVCSEMFTAAAKNVTSIEIPNTVKEIEGSAFSKLKNIKSIVIPSSVTFVGYDIFYDYNPISIKILNPNLELYERVLNLIDDRGDDFKKIKHKIIGYKNSTAEAYASGYGLKFISLGKAPK